MWQTVYIQHLVEPVSPTNHSLAPTSSQKMEDSAHKRLTVTFKDVAVQVASLGGDYGSTVASVVADLVPSFSKRSPLTVRASGVLWVNACS